MVHPGLRIVKGVRVRWPNHAAPGALEHHGIRLHRRARPGSLELGREEGLVRRADGSGGFLRQDVLGLRMRLSATRRREKEVGCTMSCFSYSAGTELLERIFSYMRGWVKAGSSSSLCPLCR